MSANKDSNDRIVMITEMVNQGSVADAIEKITKWNLEDDAQEEKLKTFTRNPIKVIVNTNGGHLTTGLGFAGFLAQSKTPIHTICATDAKSAGFIIFLGGHKRIAYTTSFIMYHQLSAWNVGNMTAMEIYRDELKTMQGKMEDFVVSRCKLKKSDLHEKDKIQKDWYFSVNELKKFEIAHEIIGYKKPRTTKKK